MAFKVTTKMIVVGFIAILIIWMFSTCGCTHGGAYGIYEGVTDMASSKEDSGVTIKTSTPEVAVDTKTGAATKKDPSSTVESTSTKTENNQPKPSSPDALKNDKKGNGSIATSASETKTKESYTNLMGYSGNSSANWGFPAPVYSYSPPSENNPLSRGELNMFSDTPFRPTCCPSSYSNSQGCACINKDQYNYLITRGGNNVPFSII
jgi:hypothetical protein